MHARQELYYLSYAPQPSSIPFTYLYKLLSLDQNQALRLCLGSTSVGGQYGAISALSINNDCSRLLCGFAKGQVKCKFSFIHEIMLKSIFKS
jgi:hypothetical protein